MSEGAHLFYSKSRKPDTLDGVANSPSTVPATAVQGLGGHEANQRARRLAPAAAAALAAAAAASTPESEEAQLL